MRAVNLIPAEERRSSRSPLAGASGGTLGLLGALVFALIVVVAYISLSNTVAERRDAVAQASTRADAFEAQAAALKPYGDVVALRDRTIATVAQLATGRFGWAALMRDLSVRVPADVTLTAMSGAAQPVLDAAAVAAAGTATVPTGPTVTLSGCTESHRSVARLMDRLRGVRGVTDVVLASAAHAEADEDSKKKKGKGGKQECPRLDHFELSLTMVGAS